VTKPKRERAGGLVVLVVVLVLALLVGGGWAAAYAGAGDKLPRGTSVAGVDVGGRTATEAEQRLRAALADEVAAPIEVTVAGETTEVDPTSAGLAVDYAASVADAGGERSWHPQRLWDYYTGGDDLDAVVTVDEDAMLTAIAGLQGELGKVPVDGQVKFRSTGQIRVVDPVVGRGLDVTATRDALVDAFLSGEPVELSLADVPPEIDEDDVRTALDEFANPAVSGPVTLEFGRARIKLSPKQYAGALALEAVGGELQPSVGRAKITRLVHSTISDDGAPVDATVELVNGKPRVVPSKPGVAFDPDDVVSTFLELVAKPDGERQAPVEAQVDQADFTTRDARDLKIKEVVGEFTTYYPYAEYRNINIGRAAEIIDGTILKPGETFSMNDIVGERTRENGFTDGFIISNGILVEDLGGGVSQMATTLFNAMFFAGLEDVEHKPHSFYIDRYPVGREATVAFGSLDLRFKNDSPYGVLVNAEVTPAGAGQGVVTVRMYSTKVWDISTTASDRYAFTSPATRTLDTPNCHANSGYGGFQIDVKRIFRKAGESEIDHVENFHTVYTPSDTVICKPPGSLDD